MVEMKSALGRLLTMVQAEQPDRAEKGLTILLACAIGNLPVLILSTVCVFTQHSEHLMVAVLCSMQAASSIRCILMLS